MSIRTITEISLIRDALASVRAEGKRISLVPTMGALHAGHLSLVEMARKNSDVVVLSIFVNPLQFNDPKDLAAYPRDLADDIEKAEASGVDIVFTPDAKDIYGDTKGCTLRAGDLAEGLEGTSRPGHFDGVVTIVNILFNIVSPDCAVFGEKDFQQLRVIQQMVSDLKLSVEILSGEVVREAKDMLALSSRNKLLSEPERSDAALIPKAITQAKERVASGESDVLALIGEVRRLISSGSSITEDYIEVVNEMSLRPVTTIQANTRLLIAAKVGAVRLIDTIKLA